MARLDLDAIRRDFPLVAVAGAAIKLEKSGAEWKACCPFHGERTPSFTIFDGGKRFHCFGCGANGDVLDFVQHHAGVGLREAARMLTGGTLPTVEIVPAAEPREPTERIEQARTIWRNAEPIKGTLADRYLRSRGLDLPLPESLRFARLRYGTKGREHPCLVAVVASREGRFMGIQRTYLNADGTGKLDVKKPKLSLGQVAKGAIRLAPAARSLVVCEGLEDGLTLAQEHGGAVWVSAGASMLSRMLFPANVESVAIGGDADERGREEAAKAQAAFASRGIKSRTFFPVRGKDFNAELQGLEA